MQTSVEIGKEKKDIRRFDPYDIMGIPLNATDDEIKVAYRKLAREWHPDKNPDDPEAAAKFILLSKAYQALSDEEGKRNYLKYGNPEGPGALHVGIALPQFLIKKENHVRVLVFFFFIMLVCVPGLGLYWYSARSKYNKHGIYEENARRFAGMLNENLALRKFSLVMGGTADFEENLTLTAREQQVLQKVINEKNNDCLANERNSNRKAKEFAPKNIQTHGLN